MNGNVYAPCDLNLYQCSAGDLRASAEKELVCNADPSNKLWR